MRRHVAAFRSASLTRRAILTARRRAYNIDMKELKTIVQTAPKFTSHGINMSDRKKASLTGVVRVDSSNETEISLTTCMGRLIITGSELKIVKFDDADGNLSFCGNIDCMKYAQAKVPLLKRIFK